MAGYDVADVGDLDAEGPGGMVRKVRRTVGAKPSLTSAVGVRPPLMGTASGALLPPRGVGPTKTNWPFHPVSTSPRKTFSANGRCLWW